MTSNSPTLADLEDAIAQLEEMIAQEESREPSQENTAIEKVEKSMQPASEILALTKTISDLTDIVRGNQTMPNLPTINITTPPINLTTVMPEQGQPSITFAPVIQPADVIVQNNIEPTPVEITNENTVNVQPTPIENNVSVEPTPILNKVDVSPTPIEVKNENNVTVQPSEVTVLPAEHHEEKPEKKVMKILRDVNGRIIGAESEEK